MKNSQNCLLFPGTDQQPGNKREAVLLTRRALQGLGTAGTLLQDLAPARAVALRAAVSFS